MHLVNRESFFQWNRYSHVFIILCDEMCCRSQNLELYSCWYSSHVSHSPHSPIHNIEIELVGQWRRFQLIVTMLLCWYFQVASVLCILWSFVLSLHVVVSRTYAHGNVMLQTLARSLLVSGRGTAFNDASGTRFYT